MRFPTSSCLLRRHSVLFTTLNAQRTTVPSRPASVLSAIHNGLRQSEKSRPQGFDRSSLDVAKPRRARESSSRSGDEDSTTPTFKIRRGKKDVTDTGPGPQSRRSRFNDPKNSFGKRSFVFQMKHGELRDRLAGVEPARFNRGRTAPPSAPGQTYRLTPADFRKAFASSETKQGKGRAGNREPMSFKKEGSAGRPPSSSYPQRSTGWESKTRSAKDARSFDNGHTRRAEVSSPGNHEASADAPSFKTGNEFSDRPKPLRSGVEITSRHQDGRHESFADTSSPKPRYGSSTDRPERFGGDRYQDRRNESSTDGFSPKTRHEPYTDRSERSDRGPYQDKRYGASADTPSPRTSYEPSTDGPRRSDGPRYQDGQDARRGQDSRKTDEGPIRIRHTTAASQFLYGRSVVEAALKDSRRQLYNLYIYDGEDRQNVQRDDVLVRLAREKDVRVTKVSNEGLPMMRKMSAERPHNGCVIEASPLPQLPLKALGALSEDPQKPGFHVDVAHQSNEDAQINGTSDFVSYQLPRGRNPFVLLLDGILDPGNLGGILRSAAFLGVNGVAITKGSSATLTPVALKASAGASEAMTLFSVSSTIDFLTRSKDNGWLVYAAVPSTKRSKGNAHLTVDRIETYDPLSLQPTILVVGSEGEGLTRQVRREANLEVSIPGAPSSLLNVVESLNVSVATGILISAFLKKQTSDMIEVKEEEPIKSEDEGDSKLW
ncbi:RNA methyltransferase [Nemania serpens]|nr:RNA methyltransferase [Nemania serpens]